MNKTENLIKKKFKTPPQDLEAEKALLGAIMLKPATLNDILDVIEPDYFYAGKHRHIYETIASLFDKGEPVDAVSLSASLKDKGLLESIGGASYLAQLTGGVPSTANLKYYAEIVRKKSALRKLIESAEKISDLAFDEKEEIDTVFDKAEQLIFNLNNFSKQTYINLKDTLTDAWERFDRLHKSDETLRGVSSGFQDLDNLLAGFQKSDLIILAARPSMGKTAFALDIARQAAGQHQVPVGLFSLEMSKEQLVDRIIAAESRVNSWKLRTGNISDEDDFAKIRDALDVLSKSPIFINDEPGNNITKIKAISRRLKSEHKLGLIIVDYLQLMIPRRETDSMVQQVTEISRSLKGLARELDVPVLALSQLSRAVESRGGKPRLSDLRDSGSIEQDADVVMFIHREDKYNENSEQKNIAEILVEKHRNGPTGKIDLYFDEKRASFLSVEKNDFGSF
ncbi:MAG: replicative DNA helicase [Patescibacteria group bacterium]